ncbi:SH3 domain-containing protein [Marinomonas balearica]|nr:SH3 domain-containing protein [Marinomonas balearica]
MKVRVIDSHVSNYPNPIQFQPGDMLILGELDLEYEGWIRVETSDGNRGWAPVQYIEAKPGAVVGYASCPYNARELDINSQDILIVLQELNEWYCVENEAGETGWVPVQCTSLLDDPATK